jgi:hypothetical protein
MPMGKWPTDNGKHMMNFLEALSYIPRPAPSPHDVADLTNSSDRDGELHEACDDEKSPAARYWDSLSGSDEEED